MEVGSNDHLVRLSVKVTRRVGTDVPGRDDASAGRPLRWDGKWIDLPDSLDQTAKTVL